jgi:hypothetical protein
VLRNAGLLLHIADISADRMERIWVLSVAIAAEQIF